MVKIAPQALADYSVSNSPGTTLSYFGYEFDVPWNMGFGQKTSGKGFVQVQFDSGRSLTLIVPANQRGLLTELVQDESLKMHDLRPVFGDLLNRSAYDQYATLLGTTPRSIRAFGPRTEAFRGVMLLTLKAIAGPGLETGRFRLSYLINVVFKSVTRENRGAWTWKFSIPRAIILRFSAARQTTMFDSRSRNSIVFSRVSMPLQIPPIWPFFKTEMQSW